MGKLKVFRENLVVKIFHKMNGIYIFVIAFKR